MTRNPPWAPTAVAGLFLAIHAPIAGRTGVLWGVDFLVGAPGRVLAGAVVAGVSVLLLPRLPFGWGRWPKGRRRLVAVGVGLVALFAALAMQFPSAVPLLGDGALHGRDLARVTEQDARFEDVDWANDNSPLAARMLFGVHSVVSARGGPPEVTFRVVGLLAGATWILLALIAAVRWGRHGPERFVVAAFLLTGGWLQLFFGYAEFYAWLPPAILGFLLVAREDARRRRAPWRAGAVLGAAVALHFALATLLPVVVYVAVAGARGRGDAARRLAVGAAAAATVGGVALLAVGFDFGAYLAAPRSSILPWFTEPTFRQAYRVASLAHLVDVVNELLLAAPAFVMSLPLLAWRRSATPAAAMDDVTLLRIASAGPLLFLLIANPEVGAFRDWDLLSFVAVPVTLWAAVALARRVPSAALARWTLPVAGAAAVHTALWIGVNADAARAEARFVRLLETASVSGHARAYGWETVGSVARDAGRADESAAAYERALQAAPESARLWALTGEAHLAAGDAEPADLCFAEALRRDPVQVSALAGQGAIRAQRGDWAGAVAPLQAAVSADPTMAPAWYNLGVALRRLDRPGEAVRALGVAVELRPAFAPAWLELGSTELERRDLPAARRALNRYLELAPNAPRAEAVRAALRTLETPETDR